MSSKHLDWAEAVGMLVSKEPLKGTPLLDYPTRSYLNQNLFIGVI